MCPIAKQGLYTFERFNLRAFRSFIGFELHLIVSPVERTDVGLHELRVFLLERSADNRTHCLGVEEIANAEHRAKHRGVDLGFLLYGNTHRINQGNRTGFYLQTGADLVKITGCVDQNDPVRLQAARHVNNLVQCFVENRYQMRLFNRTMISDFNLRITEADKGFHGGAFFLGAVR
ncbi:hypothetical protein D3C75_737190 [compost metagenome]